MLFKTDQRQHGVNWKYKAREVVKGIESHTEYPLLISSNFPELRTNLTARRLLEWRTKCNMVKMHLSKGEIQLSLMTGFFHTSQEASALKSNLVLKNMLLMISKFSVF